MCPVNKFLLISFAFPPAGVVGSLRPYRMCRYLPGKGWVPEVLTSVPRKGLPLDTTLLKDISKIVLIHRTRNIDPISIYNSLSEDYGRGDNATNPTTKNTDVKSVGKAPGVTVGRKSRIKGSIIDILTTPDKQVLWNLFAIARGIRILRREKDIRIIFVTSPPHSSQLAGAILSYMFGKPFVVDYRDPWNDIEIFEKGRIRKRIEIALENLVIRRASVVISSTQTYAELLKERYGKPDSGKFIAITNSFEEEKFDAIVPETQSKFTMAHLGIFYPQCKPYHFFSTMRNMLDANPEMEEKVLIRFIGNVDERTYDALRENGLMQFTEITGRVSHEDAIRMTKSADMLLLLMGTSNLTPGGWIPSKLIEYLACRKPILGIVPEGEAAAIIRRTNSGYAVTSDDDDAIIGILKDEFRRKYLGGESSFLPNENEISKFSNRYTIERFADTFDALVGRSERTWRSITS